MAFELTAAGLTTETREEVRNRILQRLQSKFGNTLNVTVMESISSEFAEIMGELMAGNQQLALLLYQSMDPNSATGVLLDQRAALTGSRRRDASKSTVEGILTATGVCNVPNGFVFRNTTYDTLWQTINGPYVFAGAGTLPADIEAIETGPSIAQAGDTWAATTTLANLTGFTNPDEDADLGEDSELDPAFRIRRIVELYSRGNGPIATITAVVSKLTSIVRSVRTYHNPSTQPEDDDGIPWKATNTVVDLYSSPPTSDEKQAIWDAILSATGAGGWPWASDDGYTGTSTDDEGNVHSVGFDVVAEIDVWLRAIITTGGDGPVVPIDPEQMADLIRTTCVETSTRYTSPRTDFRCLTYSGAVAKLVDDGQLSGIESISVLVGTSNPPALTTLVSIGIREKINFDTSRCLVRIDGVDY
jgi:hypothetical protein